MRQALAGDNRAYGLLLKESVSILRPYLGKRLGILAGADLFDDDRAFPAAVAGDLANRLIASLADDIDADLLVAFRIDLAESRRRAQ